MSAITWNQNEIADAIENSNPNFAWLLRECEADITVLESSIIQQNSILRIETDSTSHPVLFFVARQPGGAYKLLTGNPEAFNEIIKAEKLNIDESKSVELSDLFAELTHDRMTPLFALNSFDDIPYLSELGAEQLQKKHRDQQKFKDIVQPPTVDKEDSSFRIKRFFLDGKELQRWTMTALADGIIRSSRETLDSNVGLYYWV
jgi:hypothetical protein